MPIDEFDEFIKPYISPLEKIHAQGLIVDYFKPHTCHCEDDNSCAGRARISLVLTCEEIATRLFARLHRIPGLYLYVWTIYSDGSGATDSGPVDFLPGSYRDRLDVSKFVQNGRTVNPAETFEPSKELDGNLTCVKGFQNQKLWRVAAYAADFSSKMNLPKIIADLAPQHMTWLAWLRAKFNIWPASKCQKCGVPVEKALAECLRNYLGF